MNIETWTSNKGQQEIHHFLGDQQNTYVFGINADLLGDSFYQEIKEAVEERLQVLKHSPFSFVK